jgi:Ca-activated chloride channel family protein
MKEAPLLTPEESNIESSVRSSVDTRLRRMETQGAMKDSKKSVLSAALSVALMNSLAIALTPGGLKVSNPQDGRSGATQIGVYEVMLPISVKHKSRFVGGLSAGNFEVFEDGKRQKIEKLIESNGVPLRVAVLMDTSNSVKLKLPFEKDAAERFVATVINHRRNDQVLLATFDSDVELLHDFTDVEEPLIRSIRKVKAGGHTRLYDGVYRVIEEKLSAGDILKARRVMVVLSDGEDTASERSLKDAIDIAQRHDVTVFGISTKNFSGVGAGVVESSDDKELRRLCNETGGEFFLPSQRQGLEEALTAVADGLGNGYLLYYAPLNQLKTRKRRSIKINMKGAQGQASYRQGYVY